MSQSKLESAFIEAAKTDNRCTLGALIQDHTEGKVIAAKVADTRYSAPTICGVLRNVLGETIGKETVNKHRREQCKCFTADVTR